MSAVRPDKSSTTVALSSPLYRLPDAARLLGISGPTLKQWIYRGRLSSVKTPGGHHRIPREEIERLSRERQPSATVQTMTGALDSISGRNKLLGMITEVRVEGLLAEVTLAVGDQQLTAIITSASCRALRLEPGMTAYGLVKATEVMIVRA
jgi:molybdopterin-binding protein